MARKVDSGRWRAVYCVSLLLVCWSSVRAELAAEEIVDEAEEGESSPEYLWQFQELLRCTMGVDGITELLSKYNCSGCQGCFKQWNTGYYNLNQHPVCEQYEGQLYMLSYEYQCYEDGRARCVKTLNRCQYETCKLDTKFITCLQTVKP